MKRKKQNKVLKVNIDTVIRDMNWRISKLPGFYIGNRKIN